MAKNTDKKGITNGKFTPKGIFFWIKEKQIRWIGLIVLVIVAAWLLVRTLSSNADENGEYQVAEISRGDLIAIVGATGIVEPNQTAEVNWETSGRIKEVNVKVNDFVEQGVVLAELADNTVPQSVIQARAELVEAQKKLDDLLNSRTESAEAYQALLNAEREEQIAKDYRDEWNYLNADWDRVYEARETFLRAEEDLWDAQKAFKVVENLPVEDPQRVQAKENLDEIQAQRDRALRNLTYILGKSYDYEVAIDFADYEIAVEKLDDARREWERLKNGPDANDIEAAEARVAAAEAVVSLSWLEAPFAGTVTQSNLKVGDLVVSGSKGFRIDDLSELFVKVDISEVDINRIDVGQRADLTFDAVSGKTYQGEVTAVSSVGIDTGSGVDFEVTIRIFDVDERVRPGMTAAVNIIVNEINDVLTVPNRAIRLMEGQRIVYLLENGELREVEIEIGASSDVSSEVISGKLKEGDMVVLNPPIILQSNGGPPAFVR